MTGHVLVLNQDYRAIGVCNVQRAITLVLLSKADLISENDTRKVRTSRQVFPWPSVIRLKRYVHIPYRHVILSRRNILRRDGSKCQYCGSAHAVTIDHILPRSRGGKDTWENLVAACISCNNRKGNRTPEEANMVLHQKPYRPSHVMFIRDYVGYVEDTWKPYLYLA